MYLRNRIKLCLYYRSCQIIILTFITLSTITFIFFITLCSVVVAMGTTEAVAAAAPANGDFGSTHVMQQQQCWEWFRCASTPVTHTVVASLHLPHTS